MLKTKRLIAIFIAMTFILSLGTTSVFADNHKSKGWSGRTWLPPGIAKKAFDDLDKFPWAEQAIEKMRLKGLLKGKEEGKFAPAASVTKLESVIMALRVMGWENETGSFANLPKKYKGKAVSDWAKGYVAVAFDKGILDDVDMMYFNPEESAKRHEVAKYVIRALGYEDEAQAHMDEALPFDDASAIPQGSIGYVYLANQMKLMVGDDGRFNPMGTLTRAEMAVLFQRLDKNVDNDIDEDEYVGQIHRISGQSITLNINGTIKTFEVDEDVAVYDNNKKISYSKLSVDTYVEMQLDGDKVVYIEVTDKKEQDDKIISQYTGAVTDINQSAKKITVQIDKMQAIFEVTDNAVVIFKNAEGSFNEIVIGDSVSVIVDTRNRAREIRVDRNRQEQSTRQIDGTITKIDLVGTYYLYIDTARYLLDESADVEISGERNSVLEDLEMGFAVTCTLTDNIITKVEVDSALTTASGVITKVSANSITLTIDGINKVYQYADGITIQIDSKNSSYNELIAGMSANLKLRDGLVYRIDAENQTLTVDGKISEITQVTNGYRLTLIVNNNSFVYDVADDAEIDILGNSNESIEDLKVNQTGKFWIENTIITKIVTED